MTNKGPDGFTMIGLHELASHNGDGLVPELYALLMRRAEEPQSGANATQFPVRETRLPGETQARPLGEAANAGAKVIAFKPRTGKMDARRKKV